MEVVGDSMRPLAWQNPSGGEIATLISYRVATARWRSRSYPMWLSLHSRPWMRRSEGSRNLTLTADPAQASRVLTARWEDLDGIFKAFRGIALKDFLEYADLDLLHLVGNVCRHGDGTSLQKLAKSHPELWPPPISPPVIIDDFPIPPAPPTIDNLSIPRALLSRFVSAIASFWDETEYIYNESIECKHPNLEKKLVQQRRERAARRRHLPAASTDSRGGGHQNT